MQHNLFSWISLRRKSGPSTAATSPAESTKIKSLMDALSLPKKPTRPKKLTKPPPPIRYVLRFPKLTKAEKAARRAHNKRVLMAEAAKFQTYPGPQYTSFDDSVRHLYRDGVSWQEFSIRMVDLPMTHPRY